jgi:hypothetical protein
MSLPTVLLIAGPGRSGSTLIERILGNQEGYFSVGEARYFWEYINNDHRLCGCGSILQDCVFWQQITGSIEQEGVVDLNQVRSLSKRINRTAFLPVLYHLSSLYSSQIKQLRYSFHHLFDYIDQYTSDAVIVDSSKIGTYAGLLSRIPGMDLRVLHLVRDSRAVVHSWKYRIKRDPSRNDLGGIMKQRGLLRTAVTWVMTNHYLQRMQSDFNFYTILRYEDFVSSPTYNLNQALSDLNLPGLSRNIDGTLELLPTHSIGGNPLRFNQQISIQQNDPWVDELSLAQKRIVGFITYILMRRFNYRLKSDGNL